MISSTIKVHDMQNSPSDTISEIAFSTHHPMMMCSSWDGSVSLYNPTTPSGYISRLNYTKALLTCCFSSETASNCFSGSVDGNIQFIDLEKNILNSIKAHDDGVRSVRSTYNSIITSSWDKTIKVWDTRTAQCIKTINCDGKVYCMDLKNNLLAYGTSTNNLYSANINNLDLPKKHTPRFSFMMKCISCGMDNKSVLVGGIEGKCEMLNITTSYGGILFRSHRKDTKTYAVNSVSVYPKQSNVVVSAGSNGEVLFYDNMSRVKTFTKQEDNPVTCGTFNTDGSLYAYGLGDDWAAGYTGIYKSVNLKVLEVRTLGINLS